MCGRFVLSVDPADLMDAFGLTSNDAPAEAAAPRFNIAPTQNVLVTFNDAPQTLASAQWGLIPSWAKDASIGYKMINARAETLAEKPSFRGPLRKKRCLIYADGFYEWQKLDDGKTKLPHFISLNDGEPFAFAGLWDAWKSPQSGEWRRTCTIITTEPNELMRTLHNRMPVILPRDAISMWMGDADEQALLSLLQPYPNGRMREWEVSKRVNAPKNDDAALIARA